MLWCPEVRQTGSSDEFVRRIQTVFFSPLAMINAWADGVTPWEKGPEVEKIFRTYAGLRSQLSPYLYNAFRKMNKTGLPVVRALAVDWPQDRETYVVDDEFMYGESMLVAPVLSGISRSVYLPAGNWTDWWTGEQHTGPTHLNYSAPLERLPLFIHEGAAIAMQPAMQYSGEEHSFPLELHLYPSTSESATTLYDDDGATLDYRAGRSVEIDVSSRLTQNSVTIHVSKARGTYKPGWSSIDLKVHGIRTEPAKVSIEPSRHNTVSESKASESKASEGTASESKASESRESKNTAATEFTYDHASGVLTIKLPCGPASTVRIEI
jgi:alpha-glucosidase (family GH31 glycosyl hydrolase)